jgi:branched-subunit amino acid aminotransferase/4-amino-4-deoxychorismate lyase
MAYQNSTMLGYQNKQFLEAKEIVIAADSIAANRGYGAFDFFGVINGKPFYLERHLDRFFNTMQLMRLGIKESKADVQKIIFEVINKNELSDFHIKLFAYPLNTMHGGIIESQLFVIPVILSKETGYDYKNGIKIITKEYQRFLPEAKSTNYLPLVYWQNEIDKAGAVDVLYHSEGYIRESSRGNVFVVKKGNVSTPGEKMLRGISRSVVLDILEENSIKKNETDISVEELLNADEVFLSSTTKKILPIVKIDNHIIGNGLVGAVTKTVLTTFRQLQNHY